MIDSISDTIVLILVFLLLLGGEKNLPETVRNIGKFYQELKKRQAEFTSELKRELATLNEVRTDEIRNDINEHLIRPLSYSSNTVYQRYNDRIAQLENEIKRLRSELERLKQDGNKN